MRVVYLGGVVLLLAGIALAAAFTRGKDGPADWRIAGRDADNTRYQPMERKISAANVNQLVPRWTFTTESDVSATPTVEGNTVYFPDWAGNLYAVRAGTGELIWSRKISDYNGVSGSLSRVSPAIFGDSLIVGDRFSFSGAPSTGAHVMAVNRQNGGLRWMTTVDSHPAAIITGSPVFHGSTIYVGVASLEETLARDPAYQCCSFRGSMVALNAVTGAVLWKTYTLPDNEGLANRYSGGGIWSPPVIDARRRSLYIGTGNNYTVPEDVQRCQQDAIDRGEQNPNCIAPDDYIDTVLALDLKTGAIRWARRLSNYDVWNLACVTQPPGSNCHLPQGPDFDFSGSGPNFLHLGDDERKDELGKDHDQDLIGIGQKSGVYWALDPNHGEVVWSTQVGPGSSLGGMQWGTASDGSRIYAGINNPSRIPYTLANGGPTIDYGSWAALDPRTGKILWQIADPTPGAGDPGAVSVANGVVYAGSYSGKMHALEARTGAILFTFASGGSVIGAPSIVNGTVYWGSGYRNIGGTGNNKLYAFATP